MEPTPRGLRGLFARRSEMGAKRLDAGFEGKLPRKKLLP
jgi:hypothetical protein